MVATRAIAARLLADHVGVGVRHGAARRARSRALSSGVGLVGGRRRGNTANRGRESDLAHGGRGPIRPVGLRSPAVGPVHGWRPDLETNACKPTVARRNVPERGSARVELDRRQVLVGVAVLVGFLPAMTAYRTNVADALSS